ncbi:MAG: hypothetical protein QOE66_723, partial [Chloroflexota bacterium]|nr:hypothetical protein [Chloroflexota bacterium]
MPASPPFHVLAGRARLSTTNRGKIKREAAPPFRCRSGQMGSNNRRGRGGDRHAVWPQGASSRGRSCRSGERTGRDPISGPVQSGPVQGRGPYVLSAPGAMETDRSDGRPRRDGHAPSLPVLGPPQVPSHCGESLATSPRQSLVPPGLPAVEVKSLGVRGGSPVGARVRGRATSPGPSSPTKRDSRGRSSVGS